MSPTRSLSLLDATLLGIGAILGIGIFFTPGKAAALWPDADGLLLLWALAGVASLAGAMTFAELGGSFPRTGGWYVFLREGLGRLPAFLFAWIQMAIASSGVIAVLVGFSGGKFAELIGDEREWVSTALSLCLLWTLTGMALCGFKLSALINNATMLLKLAAVAAVSVAGFAWSGGIEDSGTGSGGLAPSPAAIEPRADVSLSKLLLPILFAFGGWHVATYIAPRIANPQRNIPRALILASVGATVVYVAYNAAVMRVVSPDEMDLGYASLVAKRLFGDGGRALLLAAMATSALGAGLVITMVTPAIYVATAREGSFFSYFAKTRAGSGVPTRALLCQAGLSSAYVAWGHVDLLVDSVMYAEWVFHALVAIVLLRLRRVRPDLPRPFRSPLYPLFPLIYLLIALGVVLGATQDSVAELAAGEQLSWREAGVHWGIVCVLGGLAVYPFFSRSDGSGSGISPPSSVP